jgi:Family of unknown function (DUF5990)
VTTLHLRVRYIGSGPVLWSGDPADFGLQDRSDGLLAGVPLEGGDGPGVRFDIVLQVRQAGGDTVVLSGDHAHGPPSARFLYLSWRNGPHAWARRLKLPLDGISREVVRQAVDNLATLSCDVEDRSPRVTSTGANIGGLHPVVWRISP